MEKVNITDKQRIRINKLKKFYNYDKDSTIIDLLLDSFDNYLGLIGTENEIK